MQTNGSSDNYSSIQISNVITWIISLTALGLSVFSLYLQRRDRRPRLKLHLERKTSNLYLGKTDTAGGHPLESAKVVEVHAANPTDKQINVVSLEFEPTGEQAFSITTNRTISVVPSHEKRHAVVVLEQLKVELEGRQTSAMEGRFVIVDALGNKHKSKRFRLPVKTAGEFEQPQGR